MKTINSKTHLRTTTRKGRNTNIIRESLLYILGRETLKKDIIHIGPGGIVNGSLQFLSLVQSKPYLKPLYLLLRLLESGLRKTLLFSLESSELNEILNMDFLTYGKYYVIDTEERVLKAAKHSISSAQASNIKFQKIDLCKTKPEIIGDIIVVFNVISRVSDQELFCTHLLSMMRQGSYLVSTKTEIEHLLFFDKRLQKISDNLIQL